MARNNKPFQIYSKHLYAKILMSFQSYYLHEKNYIPFSLSILTFFGRQCNLTSLRQRQRTLKLRLSQTSATILCRKNLNTARSSFCGVRQRKLHYGKKKIYTWPCVYSHVFKSRSGH